MRQAALLVAAVCILAVPVVAATGSTTGTATLAADSRTPDSRTDLVKEGVNITIHLQPDGDAHWRISARFFLADANDSAAFTRLADQFTARETNSGFSLDVFEAVASRVSERVGRPMHIRSADPRAARVIDHGNNSTGVLTLQFTWTNFSRVEDNRYVVDSFSGTWFGDLQPGQTLTIQPPEGYELERMQPEAAVVDGGYRWTGPQNFEPGQPDIVFTKAAVGPPRPFDISLLTLFGVGVLALVVGGVLVWVYQHVGRDGRVLDGESVFGTAQTTNAGTTPEQTTAAESGNNHASGDHASGDHASGDHPASDHASGSTAAASSELLSDEERVEQLLESNGGRMKQANIVEETRWSNAKVSQLLSAMADEERVEKLRIGRENLISLPGEGVTDEEQ